MSNRDFASKQLNMIQNRIQQAASAANRDPIEVELIGASKQQAVTLMLDFHRAGLGSFGENYLQEGLTKQKDLSDNNIDWHFIGKVQSNKCKTIAQHFDWVHSVDRLKIAERLAKYRKELNRPPINILIQVNIDEEASKSGTTVAQAPQMCAQTSELEGVVLRGFMLIPSPATSRDAQRQPFAKARETLELTNQRYGLQLDSLSMGMSADLEAAILEGSTMIRVGTALFGSRIQTP